MTYCGWRTGWRDILTEADCSVGLDWRLLTGKNKLTVLTKLADSSDKQTDINYY
jgi:hypothetical protein